MKIHKILGNSWIPSHAQQVFSAGVPMSSMEGVWIIFGIAHTCHNQSQYTILKSFCTKLTKRKANNKASLLLCLTPVEFEKMQVNASY